MVLGVWSTGHEPIKTLSCSNSNKIILSNPTINIKHPTLDRVLYAFDIIKTSAVQFLLAQLYHFLN